MRPLVQSLSHEEASCPLSQASPMTRWCLDSILSEQIRSLTPNYGAVDALIAESQSKARRRVVCFLTVFIITGFFSECTPAYSKSSYFLASFQGLAIHLAFVTCSTKMGLSY